MGQLEIKLNINIDLSESTKSFLQTLMASKPVAQAPTFACDNYSPDYHDPAPAPEKPAPAPEKPADPAPTPEKPATQAPATAAKKGVSLEDIRALMKTKVNDHRDEIKAQLNKLGYPSATKLNPELYDDFYEFLQSL